MKLGTRVDLLEPHRYAGRSGTVTTEYFDGRALIDVEAHDEFDFTQEASPLQMKVSLWKEKNIPESSPPKTSRR